LLFNSYEFLFLFLPITALVFYALANWKMARAAAAWLALASLVFYGYWSPRYVILLMVSIAINFGAGYAILGARDAARPARAKYLLTGAVVVNLGLLGYYKYANFFIDTINALAGVHVSFASVILPIGISFFTFTQIAFLVDTYQGKVKEPHFVPYLLFVTYFPHLIAGPVLHHAEMMPQFAKAETYRFSVGNFLIGGGFFLMGLFKKVVLADGIQPYVGPVFDADPSVALTALEAWGGALAYTLQLYFDFSGYSDMAIGLSKMFNVDLPFNFNSPYKAMNISDFWRRWHMTLSRFLRDYLYIPLGGNRLGKMRRYLNLMVTMLLGGLWHGAGWTFVVWGGLHGLYLVVNHLFQALMPQRRRAGNSGMLGRGASVMLTFICVVVAWVFFRATSFDAAWRVFSALFDPAGWILPLEWQGALATLPGGADLLHFGHLQAFGGSRQLVWTVLLLAAVWWLPNSQQLMQRCQRMAFHLETSRTALAYLLFGAFGTVLCLLAVINGARGYSEFIYFNF
jgi:D-alanyl-lipoteichoic acid acyltransferase DltB (MBOAT superfamily)